MISVASEKGGVGKSTTAVALASHLSSKGRTLLLDADERRSEEHTSELQSH